MTIEQANETNEQLIARLAPDYEECAKEDADQLVRGWNYGRVGLLHHPAGWRFYRNFTEAVAAGCERIYLRRRQPAPVERWKSATRGAALKALASGERVEVLACGRLAAMRWAERGPQWLNHRSTWRDDDDGNEVNYRILDTRPRRTFLGRWIEVDTFAEAEPAGVSFSGAVPVAFAYGGLSVAPSSCGALPSEWWWAARIPGK